LISCSYFNRHHWALQDLSGIILSYRDQASLPLLIVDVKKPNTVRKNRLMWEKLNTYVLMMLVSSSYRNNQCVEHIRLEASVGDTIAFVGHQVQANHL
jgi:hypothetical protein